ncbi:MAG: Fpg/Nei family DNA glycosylase [Ilumatobacter sp.]|jgi:endonuclease VIII|uniref:Fpg/Nei family DNA glycosylase n=1 Tax=Ilumatobacter sp. TaxID=1967498 RepID=UPI0039192979
MPEGHTIHRIARDHAKLLLGQPISVSSPQGRFGADAERIDGATLDELRPWGKHLFYEWSTGDVGHVHLGLFGKFRVYRAAGSSGPPPPRGAVRMRLRSDTGTVDLNGPTACELLTPPERDAILDRLGPDPIHRGAKPDAMYARIERSSRTIGELLMDQSVVAGIGNAFRAEILFVTGIHPWRPGRNLDVAELEAIWTTAQGMLRAGVSSGRILTVSREESGVPPGRRIPRAEATYVYQRATCLRCGSEISRAAMANRTVHWCSTCQPT